MAYPDTCALYLPDGIAHGPAEAFIDDHEFCHLHPLPEGSLHLTLADPLRMEAVRQGWAELHPCGQAGFLPNTLVMVYAPRNQHELAVVLELVNTSHRFAMGLAQEDS
jgi:hypothetical protein